MSMKVWGLSLRQKLWWWFVPGVEVVVKWPSGKITIDDNDPRWDWTLGSTYQEGESADPNDHYRPWLEANVGHQGWDWDWVGQWYYHDQCNSIHIKVREKHSAYASMMALKWS